MFLSSMQFNGNTKLELALLLSSLVIDSPGCTGSLVDFQLYSATFFAFYKCTVMSFEFALNCLQECLSVVLDVVDFLSTEMRSGSSLRTISLALQGIYTNQVCEDAAPSIIVGAVRRYEYCAIYREQTPVFIDVLHSCKFHCIFQIAKVQEKLQSCSRHTVLFLALPKERELKVLMYT